MATTTEMTVLQGFGNALKTLVSSLKFWTLVLALITAFAAKYGIAVDDNTYWTIVGFFGVLLGAQGLTDFGKNAPGNGIAITGNAPGGTAISTLDPAKPTMFIHNADTGVTSLHMSDGTVHDVTKLQTFNKTVPYQNQAGFAKLSLMLVIVMIGFALFTAGCGAVEYCAQPTHKLDAECVVLNDVIDCTKDQKPSVIAELVPIVWQLINKATGADGSVNWSQVDLTGLGEQDASCVLTDLALTVKPKLTPGMVDNSQDILAQARLVSGTKKVHTVHGDLVK